MFIVIRYVPVPVGLVFNRTDIQRDLFRMGPGITETDSQSDWQGCISNCKNHSFVKETVLSLLLGISFFFWKNCCINQFYAWALTVYLSLSTIYCRKTNCLSVFLICSDFFSIFLLSYTCTSYMYTVIFGVSIWIHWWISIFFLENQTFFKSLKII